MSDTVDVIERIGKLAREEHGRLEQQDVDGLEVTLKEREKAIFGYLTSDVASQDEAFLDKLYQLRDMNSRLRSEALALHQSLKEELLRLRSENKRMGGYRNGAVVTPINRRILSKRG